MPTTTRRRSLVRDMAPELEVARTEGSYLFDTRGRKYIDFVMGWCVGNFGWGNETVARAMKRFDGPDYVYPGYSYRGWDELAALLASIAPPNLRRCFRATGGSEAVDIALQAAMVHTGRRKFLSLEDSYHGNSIAGLSVGASENRETYPNLLAGCAKIEPPLDDRALARIEARLKQRDVAAFIMEPISLNLGVLVPDAGFMTALQRLCRRYRTLLILDEVATGFGRTGRIFASEHFGLQPDILCIAKAVTGGAAGLGAVIATAAVGKSMEEDGSFYSTYGWHPRSVAAALAAVRFLVRHQKRLLGNVERMGEYFRARLSQMEFDGPASVRAKGLAIGVDVGNDDYADRIETKCRRKGLLVSTEGSTLLLLPPLDITRDVASAGLDILEACA